MTSDNFQPGRLHYAGSLIVNQQFTPDPALERAYDTWYYTSNTTTTWYQCPTCQQWYPHDLIIDKHDHPCLSNLRFYHTRPYYAEYWPGTRRAK